MFKTNTNKKNKQNNNNNHNNYNSHNSHNNYNNHNTHNYNKHNQVNDTYTCYLDKKNVEEIFDTLNINLAKTADYTILSNKERNILLSFYKIYYVILNKIDLEKTHTFFIDSSYPYIDLFINDLKEHDERTKLIKFVIVKNKFDLKNIIISTLVFIAITDWVYFYYFNDNTSSKNIQTIANIKNNEHNNTKVLNTNIINNKDLNKSAEQPLVSIEMRTEDPIPTKSSLPTNTINSSNPMNGSSSKKNEIREVVIDSISKKNTQGTSRVNEVILKNPKIQINDNSRVKNENIPPQLTGNENTITDIPKAVVTNSNNIMPNNSNSNINNTNMNTNTKTVIPKNTEIKFIGIIEEAGQNMAMLEDEKNNIKKMKKGSIFFDIKPDGKKEKYIIVSFDKNELILKNDKNEIVTKTSDISFEKHK